jgi:hypothetical protein
MGLHKLKKILYVYCHGVPPLSTVMIGENPAKLMGFISILNLVLVCKLEFLCQGATLSRTSVEILLE